VRDLTLINDAQASEVFYHQKIKSVLNSSGICSRKERFGLIGKVSTANLNMGQSNGWTPNLTSLVNPNGDCNTALQQKEFVECAKKIILPEFVINPQAL